MEYHKGDAFLLSRLFTAAVFRDFGRYGRSPLFTRLVQQSQIGLLVPKESSVGAVFDAAYHVLKQTGMRDEYVYRNALTEKILLGRHSLNTATMLREVRTGASKADVVVLNGTSTAYEIKSERDSLARLDNQLNSYRNVFAAVNVVASPLHVRDVLAKVPDDVGVISLSTRFTLQTEREAQNRPDRTSPLLVLELLRVDEALAILKALDINAPEVPNTQIRSELGRIFAALDPEVAHGQMVRTLKESRSQAALAGFVGSMPSSLRAAFLGMKSDAKSRIRVKEAVETPLAEALAWK
ncbi:sce7726 family protein [Paenarthrobacter aurescens]|uniref:sce7726 family protein n=1 Tax=Paenarthrobacter aurescens TaxID=43663 RepID=UPI0021C21E56|nr:sce7726 family protein [Paenarthrobacter aurescens]MCT9871624.1 sce7726 family protein [Paenarthrobacter aurescens]